VGSRFTDGLLAMASKVAGREGWLNELLNSFIINRLANAGRNRPHPWSTRDDYVSWAGLTDRTYSARLLPPAPQDNLPPADAVARLFIPSSGGQRRCAKSTMLFAAFAQYLTDGFIRTQLSNDDAKEDRTRTTSNHEIDMSPLYGRTAAQTRALRTMDDDPRYRGKLKSRMIGNEEFSPFLYKVDGKTIEEDYIGPDGEPQLDLPLGVNKPWAVRKTLMAVGGDRVNASPQVMMINTLFLREHNRLAALIAQNNKGFDDERVFETARNVVIVMFIKIVVEEYINHISTAPFSIRALPQVAWKAKWNRPNWITAEFSLLYRWHSLVPETLMLGGYPLRGRDMTLDNTRLLQDGLQRGLIDISSMGATEIGLGNTADFLLPIEHKAIEQARLNHIAPYNAYRVAMGMKPAKSFAEITGTSSDKREQARREDLATALERLYGHVDRVEFYVGLFAEPPQRNGPLPPLLQSMVAMDAFTQALTNPLMSEHIWSNEKLRRETFSLHGWDEIRRTSSIRDILLRNSNAKDMRHDYVGMTRKSWTRT
jgi:prostaglandin-endoperoxide synthase 2